jgi:CRP/FNR family transcriptional regulator
LYLQQIYGFESDGQTLNIAMSREDIANLVGTATETTIRLLSELKNDEVIRLNGKKIAIINQKQLIRIANVLD